MTPDRILQVLLALGATVTAVGAALLAVPGGAPLGFFVAGGALFALAILIAILDYQRLSERWRSSRFGALLGRIYLRFPFGLREQRAHPYVGGAESEAQRATTLLNTRSFTEHVIYLTDYCRTVGVDEIHDKIFNRCIIEGPAVCLANEVSFVRPLFEADRGIEQIFFKTDVTHLNGIVSLRHVTFIDCRFRGVGFITASPYLESLRSLYSDVHALAEGHVLTGAISGVPPVVPPPKR